MAENSNNSGTPNQPSHDDGKQRSLLGRRRDLMSPTARLPSIRTPRDLMLKGAVKKTFKPNIPVRRERTKDDSFDGGARTSSPTPSKRARGRGRGGSRGRGRGGRNKDLIQTHNSIFEEGPGEKLVRRSTTEGFGRSSSSTSKGNMASSSTLASSFRNLNLKRSERDKEDSINIAELLRDDFLKDSSLAIDEKFRPVCLPLKSAFKGSSSSSSSSSSTSSLQDITEDNEPGTIKIKEEPMSPGATVKVKQEPPDSDDDMKSIDSKDDSLASRIATSVKGPESKKSSLPLFSQRDHLEGKLLFFQLPDSLPGMAPSGDDEMPRAVVHVGQGTSSQPNAAGDQASEAASVKTECTLEDLPAGFLGKLRIRKSGKTELKLGNITLDVSVGTPCGFLQDIVSVRKGQDHHELVNLGQVKHRIVCTPNLLSLLKDR